MKTSFSNKIATVPLKAKAKSNDNDYEYKCTIPLVSVPDETLSEEERKFSGANCVLPVTAGVPSPTYDIWVKRFEMGTPARWLQFLLKWEEVRTQLNLTNGPELYTNFKTLLGGDALSKWREVATNEGTETVANFATCICRLTTYVFPEDALSTQQSYLSNLACKTKNHSWRQYDVRLHEENKNLAKYPLNFNNNQKLPDAVLRTMVCLLYTSPSPRDLSTSRMPSSA